MAAHPGGRGGRQRPRIERRSIVAFVLLGLIGMGILVMAVLFLWPQPAEGRYVDVGHIDRFAPGSVISFRIVEGGAQKVSSVPRQQVPPRYGVHVVRLADGDLRVFSWASTHLRWAVDWRPEMEWEDETGLFADSFGLWSLDGRVQSGPPARDLDRFAFEVTGQGRVMIDLRRLIEGERRAQPAPYDGPPTVTPTPSTTPPTR